MRKPFFLAPAGIAVLLVPLGMGAGRGLPSTLTFEAWSPLARPETVCRRFQWSAEEFLRWGADEAPLDLGREFYSVYRPPSEDSSCLPGLLVWISPVADGSAPKTWEAALDRHHLAWIGALNAGNSRKVLARLTLALQAAENLLARGEVDPARIYVAGLSGGGRCASELALAFPDLFAGGFYIVGCDYFRALPVPGNPGYHWDAAFARPPRRMLRLARPHRYVFLTGSADFNRDEVKAVFDGYRSDGFRHVAYIEVPGMPHGYPSADWFERGLEMLER